MKAFIRVILVAVLFILALAVKEIGDLQVQVKKYKSRISELEAENPLLKANLKHYKSFEFLRTEKGVLKLHK